MEYLCSNLTTMERISIYRKEHFNAAHRLHNPMLSDAENKQLFGKCNNLNFHGHNYELIVKVTGEINTTGYVIDTKLLSDIIRENVTERYDHKNLNLDIEEFRTTNPTSENIAISIYDILRQKINGQLELKIFLYETERNFVEYPA
jgi:6-pyruvoyltetrahydropterin/6-carboxytetrahydropterin synthase